MLNGIKFALWFQIRRKSSLMLRLGFIKKLFQTELIQLHSDMKKQRPAMVPEGYILSAQPQFDRARDQPYFCTLLFGCLPLVSFCDRVGPRKLVFVHFGQQFPGTVSWRGCSTIMSGRQYQVITACGKPCLWLNSKCNHQFSQNVWLFEV